VDRESGGGRVGKGRAVPCANTAITFQHRLLAICERSFRLHSHRHSSTVTTPVIRLRVLDLCGWFRAGVLGRDVLRINRFAIICVDLEVKEIESKILKCIGIKSNIHPRRRAISLPHYAGSASRTKHMRHSLRSKLILLQRSLAFRDSEATRTRKDPFVAFLEADAAVTFHDAGQFRKLDGEFEGAAVAVPFVGLEVGGWLGHVGVR